ncbi:MAG: diguanylate cyclase [Actinomycetota bacterium]|nr:diguanylate cyclase [Actinomycetota bacterium]
MEQDEADYRTLVEHVPAMVYRADVGGADEWHFVSPQVEAFLGYSPTEFTSDLWLSRLYPEDRVRVLLEEDRDRDRPDGSTHRIEYRFRSRDGRLVWISDEYVLMSGSDGRRYYRGVMLDITERKEIEAKLALQGEHFRSLVQHASDVIVVVDARGSIKYVSPSVERVLGFSAHERMGRSMFDLVHPDDVALAKETMAEIRERTGKHSRIELRVRHKDGFYRWLEVSMNNLLEDPNIQGIFINYRDVSERKIVEEQLRHNALHDPLTGLANRSLLVDRLEHAIAASARRNEHLAVLFIDLDDFKSVNDLFGHAAGDQILIAAAGRIKPCLRSEDTASRLGGDEFVVLLEGVEHESDATTIAKRMLESLHLPFVVGDRELSIHASIGIAVADAPQDVHALLRNADAAMYAAKSRGPGRYEVFRSPAGAIAGS